MKLVFCLVGCFIGRWIFFSDFKFICHIAGWWYHNKNKFRILYAYCVKVINHQDGNPWIDSCDLAIQIYHTSDTEMTSIPRLKISFQQCVSIFLTLDDELILLLTIKSFAHQNLWYYSSLIEQFSYSNWSDRDKRIEILRGFSLKVDHPSSE